MQTVECHWVLFADMGVLVGKGGFYGNVFRITPPLCFTKEDAGDIAIATRIHQVLGLICYYVTFFFTQISSSM